MGAKVILAESYKSTIPKDTSKITATKTNIVLLAINSKSQFSRGMTKVR